MRTVEKHPNLCRAIDIALTGNFSITVYYSGQYEKGAEDYHLIKKELKGIFENFSSNGDIWVQIDEPYETKGNYTHKFPPQKNPDFIFPAFFEESVIAPLKKKAMEYLDFDKNDIEKAIEISSYIAVLEEKGGVELQYFAEAIQFSKRMMDYESHFVIAENLNNVFGGCIEIKGEVPQLTAMAAIDYLKRYV